MKKEDPCEKLTFQFQLLLEMEEMRRYPFTRMIIEKGLTEKEFRETIQLLEELNHIYESDLNFGLLDHSSLLIHFAGMLPHQLPIEESIEAIYDEGLFPELTAKLLQLLRK